MSFDLIGVPYSSMAKPRRIANAIHVLREVGLAEHFAATDQVRDMGDLERFEGSGVRGTSGLLNERALGHLVTATREAVLRSLDRGRRPLLVGGDCPVLLGALAAGRARHGAAGLLLVDGHEDAWPPRLSPTLGVLSTEDFPAADYTQPGGLTWEELLEIARPPLAASDCLGCSIVIYNPDLDPKRKSAARIVRFASDLVSA